MKLLWYFRCKSEATENYTISELKQLANENGKLKCLPLEAIQTGVGEETCSEWIYESDHGFDSLTSEVKGDLKSSSIERVGGI